MIQLSDSLEKYENNPVLRGLAQLIPFGIGSGVDVALCTHIKNIRNDRINIFFNELDRGDIMLSSKLIESEDFLHCYFATAKAALNSRRREKIEMFARLLKSSIKEQSSSNIDEYEAYLGILDELSYRELCILFRLYEFESDYPYNDEENDLQHSNHFWAKFILKIEDELGVPPNESDAILIRLTRTGCYETFIGNYLDNTGGQGKTTPTFKRLKELIENNSI